jgi:hypothetical protein
MILIESQYFPPLSSFIYLYKEKHIGIPLYEKFRKMGFQNRCMIPTSNGVSILSVPLRGGRDANRLLTEVMIDNSQRWQTRHWRTLTAAYNRSPFFEFQADELRVLYETRFDLLYEWNLACLTWLLKGFGRSGTRVDLVSEKGAGEVRGRVLSKQHTVQGLVKDLPVYQQVFGERQGFIPNMSSIDLLFCVGKEGLTLFSD